MSKQAIRRVLAGTSLSAESDRVLADAARLSRALGARLEVFHAFQQPPAYFVAASGLAEIDPSVVALNRRQYEELCRQQLERLGLAEDPAVSLRLEAGARHRMLLARAEEIKADLIVVGAHEKGEWIELGSTAERVLRRSRCPVLVLHEELSIPVGRVLALSDLSPVSEVCLRRGLEVVRAMSDGREPTGEVFFVMTPVEREGTGLFPGEEMEQLALAHLSRWAKGLRPDTRARLEPALRIGEPRREILAKIDREAPELVITATHGRGGFDRFLLGSTAEAVVRRTSANILVVPAKEDGAPAVSAALEEEEPGEEEEPLSPAARRRIALSEALGPEALAPPLR